LRIRTGSVYAAAAFYAIWMSVANLGTGVPDALSAVVSSGLIVLAGMFLLRYGAPRSDTWPSSITPSREQVAE
jgi:hypothetical protein